MSKYKKYLKLMSLNKLRPLPESTLKSLWDNWHCEDEEDKKSFHQYGLNNHWRETQLRVMRELGITEKIRFTRGGDSRPKPVRFTSSTSHLFATCQNAIMSKREFLESSRA